MKTLPEHIQLINEEGEIVQRLTSDVINNTVKRKKVKALTDEEGEVRMQPVEVVRNILLQNFRTPEGQSYELPDEMSDYGELNDYCASIVESHREAANKQKEKSEAEKAQKQAEKEAAKEAKKKEDEAFAQAGQEFDDIFEKRAKKIADKRDQAVTAMLSTAKALLPKTATMAEGGLGIVMAENATRADIAQAAAGVISSMENVASMQSALQFSMGDIVNAAVRSKAFRSKGDACSAIKNTVHEKLGKKFNVGTLNYYAIMAERVPVDKRKSHVQSSLYLEVSKLTLPRAKDAKPSDAIALDAEVEAKREELIEAINNGNISSIKDAKKAIEDFKKEKGFAKDKTTPASVIAQRLFFAIFIKKYLLGDKDEIKVQIDAKNTKTYSRKELSDIEEDCMNQLQQMLVKQKFEALVAGFITKGKGDKAEKIDYLLDNPFGVEVEKDEAPAGEVPAEEEEEEEEEEGEEEGDDA